MATTTNTTSATTLATVLQKLTTMRGELNARFLESSDRVDMVLASLIARQHCLMLGPAGEAKSAITDAIRARITGGKGFKKLVARTTTIDELFGIFDIPSLKAGHYQRVTRNRLPEAHVAFIDEIFKSNSTLLNSLLDAMNEREFEQDGVINSIPLITLIGASNELPQSDDLGALWDRFVMRQWVQPLTKAGRRQFVADEMTRRQANTTGADTSGKTGTTITLDELRVLQNAALAVAIPDEVRDAYWRIEEELEIKGYALPSTRRLGWLWNVVGASALLNGRTTANEDDLLLLRHAMWQQKQDIKAVGTIVMTVAAPMVAQAQDIYDRLVAEVAELMQFSAKAKSKEEEAQRDAKMLKVRGQLKKADEDLKRLYNEAKGAGRDTTEIQRMARDLRAKTEQVTAMALDTMPNW